MGTEKNCCISFDWKREKKYSYIQATTKQGDSDCEIIICFSTKFKLPTDLTDIGTDIDIGIYLTSL